MRKQPKSNTEYLLKVNLKGSKRIWRTIAIGGERTLEDLHEAIFVAFDRDDEHLYSFYFPRAPRRRETNPNRIREYTAPFLLEGPDPFDDASKLDAAETTLDDLKLKPGQTFEYLFDFGDSWWHEL